MAIQKEQIYSKEQSLQKAKHFCAYQERCHQEVKDKLYGFGLHRKDVDELLSQLIEENYLNEERFAVQFAGGHFRMKQWGKVKIKQALKQKSVGDYCIRKALLAIAQEAYWNTLLKLTGRKALLLKKELPFVKKHKLYNYLLQKGYESDLIREAIEAIDKEPGD